MEIVLVDTSSPVLPTALDKLNQLLQKSPFFDGVTETTSGTRDNASLVNSEDFAARTKILTDEKLQMTRTSAALERWDMKVHTFSKEKSADVNFFAGLFGAEAKNVSVGVVHEMKRFSTVREGNFTAEVGVTVRLSAATTSLSAEIKAATPTLANLAANAQLNGSNSDTKIAVSVMGYIGKLDLPAPQQLDVESFAVYLEAFKKIQQTVFESTERSRLCPCVIAYYKMGNERQG